MSEQDTDKSEQATPHKLEEARNRGQVSKSVDVNAVVMLTAFTVVFAATLPQIAGALANTTRRLILSAGQARLDGADLMPWIGRTLEPVLMALSPLLIALLACAVLSNILQTGPVFSTYPMKPDFSRLNPATGLKRIFNLRILFELFKTLVKLGLVGGIVLWGYTRVMTDIGGWGVLPAQAVPGLLRHLAMVAVTVLLGVFAVVAMMDFMFSRREFARKMRMSKREVKDEYKRREGDPEIRAKRRRLHAELRKRAEAVRKVKDADVVLVNPVRFAVALRYRPAEAAAPVVLAVGAGVLAARIRERARRHGVPVVHDQPLARLLYKACRLGDVIPFSCYRGVAAVYRRLAAMPGSKVSLA